MFPIQVHKAVPSRPRAFLSIALLCAVLLIATATSAVAQIAPAKESLSDLYPGKAYSPYAQRSFPDQVFWGDTHLHTALSMDAGLFGARIGLDDAYRLPAAKKSWPRAVSQPGLAARSTGW